jgi:hypothetical protein
VSINPTINVHALSSNWAEMDTTWSKRTDALNWSAGGGDYGAVVSSAAFASIPSSGWLTFTLPASLVESWIASASANRGILIKPSANSGPGAGNNTANFWFATSEHLAPSLRPKLELTYTASANVKPFCVITSPTPSATAIPGQYLALIADAVDPDGSVSRVDFYADGTLLGHCSTPPYSLSWRDIPSGQTRITAVATDNAGHQTTSAAVTATFASTIYQTSMDGNPNWGLGSGWAYGQPQGIDNDYGNGDPASGYTGENVIGYNLSGAYGAISKPSYATAPVIDCSNYTNTLLSYWYWLGVEGGSWDHAAVEVSNNGTRWTTLWANPSIVLSGGSWRYASFDLSSVADRQGAVYVRWRMGTTDSSYHYGGWNLDDVRVSGMHVASGQDADGDAVSDLWETAYFGSTNAVMAHPDADPDKDGMSNFSEFEAGTDPTDPASVLELSIAISNGVVQVICPTLRHQAYGYPGSGRYYDLLYRTDLTAGDWTPLPGGTNILGNDQPIRQAVPSVTSSGMFGVRVSNR